MSTGILVSQQLRKLVENGTVYSECGVERDQIQPNSIDLTIGEEAVRTRCSFLPMGHDVAALLKRLTLDEKRIGEGLLLEPGCTYILPIREGVRLSDRMCGKTNPRSTMGRLDVMCRVLTDRASVFDEVAFGYHGRMYLEVTSQSFPVVVRPGDRLVQLRIAEGSDRRLTDLELIGLQEEHGVIRDPSGAPVDPERLEISDGVYLTVFADQLNEQTVGFSSRESTPIIDYRRRDHPIGPYWNRIYGGGPISDPLVLAPKKFYIMRSYERVLIPKSVCAEMVPYDSRAGELRTHYAGFFDSGFGLGEKGSHVVLEVRNHEIPFLIQHRQRVFRLLFFWNAEDPDSLYGLDSCSYYQGQGLRLARQFGSDKNQPSLQTDLF